jgi:hypothetical protein
MSDKELVFENTPLENLRSILSEADASAETAAPVKPSSVPDFPVRATVNKAALKGAIQALQAEPQQFMSQSFINQTLRRFTGLAGGQEGVFENRHVVRLEKLITGEI